MVPLGTLVDMRDISGPVMVTRYNLYTAAPINGSIYAAASAPARRSASIDRLADETLPRSMNTEWTELMFMQIQAGNTAMYVFAPGGGVRVPGAGGAVRELVAAAGGDPGGADVPALFGRRASLLRRHGRSTSSCRSASWCWSGWPARTPS